MFTGYLVDAENISQWGLQVTKENAYLFDQGELGEGPVCPPGTTLNGTAVKRLSSLQILSDCGIYDTILRMKTAEGYL